MEESDFRDSGRLPPPAAWGDPANAPAANLDVHRPANEPSGAFQWGLTSLIIGCTIGLASGLTTVIATILFYNGPRGMPTAVVFACGLINVLVVTALGIASVIFGIHGWKHANEDRASPAMPIAGVAASAVGLFSWIMAGIELILVLGGFIR